MQGEHEDAEVELEVEESSNPFVQVFQHRGLVILPAMNVGELQGFFGGMQGKAPAEVLAYLKGIAERVLGVRAKLIF